jgi:hypothetical protein
VALGCTLTQFDHFDFLAMTANDDMFGFGTQATWTPGPNPSADVSRSGDKSPFKQVHRKGDDSGDCRTFTSDLLSGLVGLSPRAGRILIMSPSSFLALTLDVAL